MEEQNVNNPRKILGLRGIINEDNFESPLTRHFKEKDDLWKSVTSRGLNTGLKGLLGNYKTLKSQFDQSEIKSIDQKFRELGINENESEDVEPTKELNKNEFKQELEIKYFERNLILIDKRIEEIENKPKEKWSDFWKTLIGIGIGAGLTAGSTYFLQQDPLKMVIRESPTQKIQIVYDTIFLAIPKNQNRDTSLVRIVKLKGKH